MENYQWSLTWWIFRFITIAEVGAIIYLFITTWRLHTIMDETHKTFRELLKRKQNNCAHSTEMLDEVELRFTDLHKEFKRKEYDNDKS